MVRAFYLDIAQWAAGDPARWAAWAVPCPIRDEEMSRKKERARRKSRMDQRTSGCRRCPGRLSMVRSPSSAVAGPRVRRAAARSLPA